jgi:signal transduction histidine kinase
MKKNNKIRFWLAYHILMLAFSILTAMFMKYNQTGKAFVPETILAAATLFTMYVTIGYIAIYFINKGNKLSHAELNKKIVPGFLIFIALTFILANIEISLGVFIWFLVKGFGLDGFFTHLFRNELSYANRNLYLWMLFFSIVFFYILWRKSSRKEQTLREDNLRYRYQTLKSKVNPHFLFNSINTISELLYTDIKKADNSLQELSGIYRYVLENEEKDLISLDKELEFVRQYFNLQKERDEDRIFLETDISNAAGYQVIPVSLQQLVENALKHNSGSRENPLVIQISVDGDFLVVTNEIRRKTTLENSTHTGLSNLKERVRLVTGRELTVSEEAGRFVVRLPVERIKE